jgi:DNA polymerase-3 subunit alpha
LIALSGAREGDIGRAILAGLKRKHVPRWKPGWRCSVIASTSNCSAPGAPAKRNASPVAATGGRLRCAGRRDQRRAFPAARGFRSARGASLHPRGRIARRCLAPRRFSEEQYLRSPQEMAELFADLPEAIEKFGRDSRAA